MFANLAAGDISDFPYSFKGFLKGILVVPSFLIEKKNFLLFIPPIIIFYELGIIFFTISRVLKRELPVPEPVKTDDP